MALNTEKLKNVSDLLNLEMKVNVPYNPKYVSDAIYCKYFSPIVSPAVDCVIPRKKIIEFHNFLEQRTNLNEVISATSADLWVFGYGSLMWKADFSYIDRRRGFICGYKRRFYQHSIDHRGTAERPGRVVTLIATHNEEDRVYGVAYRIASKHIDSVVNHLDYREKNGYERCELKFFEFVTTNKTSNNSIPVVMYIATHENQSYAGDIKELPLIAHQILTSAGQSGPNRDYLFNLADTMRELFPGVNDYHLFQLEDEVLNLKKEEKCILRTKLTKKILELLSSLEDSNEIKRNIEELEAKCLKLGWREEETLKSLKCKSVS